jgi:hypothetical protein
MFTAMSDNQGGTLIGVQQAHGPGHNNLIPPPDTFSGTLNSGDTLTVNDKGTSTNVVVQGGATEIVNQGGKSSSTTINFDEGLKLQGVLAVTGGTLDITTINGGKVVTFGSTVNAPSLGSNTKLFLPGSEFYAFDGSVIKDHTTIINGTLFLDATSTASVVTFATQSGLPQGPRGVVVENPSKFPGIAGELHVGDFIQFGGISESSPDIHVTSFDAKTNTITYDDGNQHDLTAHLNLSVPSGDMLNLTSGTSHGHSFSTLTVATATDAIQLTGVLATSADLLMAHAI